MNEFDKEIYHESYSDEQAENVKNEIMVGDDIHIITSESDMLKLIELMKLEGRFGDPIMCPMCNETHKLNSTSFETPEECIFHKTVFYTKLDAVESMKKFHDFVKTLTSPRKVYLHDKNKILHNPNISDKFPVIEKQKNQEVVEIMPLIKANYIEKPVPATKQIKSILHPEPDKQENINKYGIITKKLVNTEDIKKVVSIVKEKTENGWSRADICAHFNKNNVPSLSGKKPWNVNSLYQFLVKYEYTNENIDKATYIKETAKEKKAAKLEKIKQKNILINTITEHLLNGRTAKEICDFLNDNNIKTLTQKEWSTDGFAWFKSHYIPNDYKKKHTVKKENNNTLRRNIAIKEIKKLMNSPSKRYSQRQMAADLNQRNIKTVSGKGKWTEKTMHRLIKDHIKK